MSDILNNQSSFERAHNMLELPDARKTGPRTINVIQPLLGLAGQYTITTIRRPNESGWTLLLTIMNAEGTYRHVLPNEVCEGIHQQRERLLGPVKRPKPRLTPEERYQQQLRDSKRFVQQDNARKKAARNGGAV